MQQWVPPFIYNFHLHNSLQWLLIYIQFPYEEVSTISSNFHMEISLQEPVVYLQFPYSALSTMASSQFLYTLLLVVVAPQFS